MGRGTCSKNVEEFTLCDIMLLDRGHNCRAERSATAITPRARRTRLATYNQRQLVLIFAAVALPATPARRAPRAPSALATVSRLYLTLLP